MVRQTTIIFLILCMLIYLQGCATGLLNNSVKKGTTKYQDTGKNLQVNSAYMSSKYELYICLNIDDIQGSLRVPLYKYMAPYRNRSLKLNTISYISAVTLHTCNMQEIISNNEFDNIKYHDVQVVKLYKSKKSENYNVNKKLIQPMGDSIETLYVFDDSGELSFLYVNKEEIFRDNYGKNNRITIKAPATVAVHDNAHLKSLYLLAPVTITVDIITLPVQVLIGSRN